MIATPTTKPCIINNQHCTPRPCEYCQRVFCAHEHPKLRAFGYYGQYCSEECQSAKYQQLMALGQERWKDSRVVLIVEARYCYLVCNKAAHYGYRILQENATSGLDYCHYPGFSTGEGHPVTFAMYPGLEVTMTVEDEKWHSMWTIVGFRVLDGEIDTYGVGGHIEVIDRRKEAV